LLTGCQKTINNPQEDLHMKPMFLMFVLGIFIGCSEDKSPTANQTVDPTTEPTLTADLLGGASMNFVWIEPGSFMMGSPTSERGRFPDETLHQVTLTKGFYLGKYEVTQRQWKSVMGTTPYAGQDYVQPYPNHPAVYVSWEDAQAFINKLNAAAGKPIYRLPTEAEWEYAARAGTTTRWSFGDDESQLGNYAWISANAWYAGERFAHPVGTKLPNPWGLYDMHGNVWEWCQDWDGDYPTSAQIDPLGPSTGSYRMTRGGAFDFYARGARSANRDGSVPGRRGSYIGFRLLRTE
jgi:sulfatase modifying factor 1